MLLNVKGLLTTMGILICLFHSSYAGPPVKLKKGLILTTSARIQRYDYNLDGSDSLNQPVIFIRGNNITIDFDQSTLHGSNDKQLPNQFYGLAILIEGDHITLKNARISGFKVAVMAKGCRYLKIESCNFSYNYRQRLQSDWMREDVSDWMSYHHNENDEWLRYGAGIYLKDCLKPVIHDNIITGGQCGLMMMRCNEGMIYDNDLSFNSGIGIGMYRSSKNNILHNKLDFNVRGYSHGFYNRGQDSAGILVFEQCNENTFAWNSVTHSGDGFFLWAGQTTMDSGLGGCNWNYLFKNDFSYAPTNGVEVTFSKNTIQDNIIRECDNGIWGGYSWGTIISGNLFEKNRTGIAIEHGQHNAISNNQFTNNIKDGIKLWARKIQPSDWGYANKKDTRSMHYEILGNRFENENNAFNATLTDDIIMDENKFIHCKNEMKTDSSVTHLQLHPENLFDSTAVIPAILDTWKSNNIPVTDFPKGRNQMRITEWGPYDFRYPIIFLKNMDSNGIYHFDILGPKGKWKISNTRDITNLSASEGIFPATLTAKKTGTDVQLNAVFTGERFISQFGKEQDSGKSQIFSFHDFDPEINWDVRWFSWDTPHDPNRNYEAFKTVYNNIPVKTEAAKHIDYTWWGEIGKHLPADSFTTLATGTVDLEKGKYLISVTADDLVKVYIDGKLVIDFWDAAKYKYDEDTHHELAVTLNGKHTIRIEHVENSGYATLIFRLKTL